MKFNYIRTVQEYQEALPLIKKGEPLALDTETMCRPEYEGRGGSALDPHTGRISLVITLTRGGIPQIFDLLCLEHEGYDPSALVKALDDATYLLGANIKFDAKQLRGTLGYEPLKMRDIILMAKLVSNATGSKAGKAVGHSYKDLCREYLNVHLDGKGTLQKSTWATGISSRSLENEWWAEKLQYAANDVHYLFPIYDLLEEVLTNPLPNSPLTQTGATSKWGFGMAVPLRREMEMIPVTAEMEYEGLPVSKKVMTAFQRAVSEELQTTAVWLSRELGLDTPQTDWEGKEVASPKALKVLRSSTGLLELIKKALDFKKIDNVQAQTLSRMLDILDALYRVKGDSDTEEGTGEDIFVDEDEARLYEELTLLEHSELVATKPIISKILDFKRLVKQEGMDLRKYINPATGRIHPSYSQIGTATARLSCASPNSQQISNKTKVIINGLVPLGIYE